MTNGSVPLPWEDLRRVEGDLPWTALETFAEAVVDDPTLAQELFVECDKAWRAQAEDVPTYLDLYVPAIFALAAPRLGDEQRRTIGSCLVDRLIEAGKEGADLTEEALLAAAGSLGPVILPKVLEALESRPEGDDSLALSCCWNLTPLAARTDDAAVRDRTIRACIRLLEQVEYGTYEAWSGVSAAWTLVLLNYPEAAPLLHRLGEKADSWDGGADYREALEFLQGQRTEVHQEAWERPVREWLESLWETAREYDAERKAEIREEEEEEAAFQRRAQELTDAFLASRWAAELPADWAEDAASIAHTLLEYAHTHEGAAPEELTRPALRSVLLEAFPRKMSAKREFFEKVPPVVKAFLQWMAAEGILPEGESLAQTVSDWADDIVAAGMAPANWGPAKRSVMEGMRAGIDMTDQQAVYERMVQRARRGLEEVPYELMDETPITPPIPIVEHSPRVGRNDPCPCGSGKKYKKCCGNPAKDHAPTA